MQVSICPLEDAFIGGGGVSVRKVIASSLVIALGAVLLYIFSLFWLEGRLIIQEPNSIILSVETVMAFFILLFGIERLIRS